MEYAIRFPGSESSLVINFRKKSREIPKFQSLASVFLRQNNRRPTNPAVDLSLVARDIEPVKIGDVQTVLGEKRDLPVMVCRVFFNVFYLSFWKPNWPKKLLTLSSQFAAQGALHRIKSNCPSRHRSSPGNSVHVMSCQAFATIRVSTYFYIFLICVFITLNWDDWNPSSLWVVHNPHPMNEEPHLLAATGQNANTTVGALDIKKSHCVVTHLMIGG